MAVLPDGSTVTRSFSNLTVRGLENLTVTLTVTLYNGRDWYVVDEVVPPNFEILNTGGAKTNETGRLKWAVTQNAVNTILTYKLRAYSTTTTKNVTFNGTYAIANMSNETSWTAE